MGRKIPGRKHRGVRDILEQNAKIERSLIGKINAPPQNPDDQAIPKSLARVMELKQKVKDGIIGLKRKRKKKTKSNLVSSADKFPLKQKRPGRPEKPVPVFQQLPGESGKKFMGRVNCIVKEYLNANKFEQKYQVDIQRNEITGEVEGVKKKPVDEIDELMKKSLKVKKTKKKDKKSDDSTEKLSKSQKRSAKLKAKKLKKLEESKPLDFDMYKDEVKFGEVVDAPPILTKFPRKISSTKIPVTSEEPKKKKRKAVSDTLELQSLNTGKRKNLSAPVRNMLEEQRKAAVNAYKTMKLQNEANNKK